MTPTRPSRHSPRRARPAAWGLAAALATLVTGCPRPPDAAVRAGVAVLLVEPGAEPRRPFAHGAPPPPQSVWITARMQMAVNLDGEAIPTEAVPVTRTLLRFEEDPERAAAADGSLAARVVLVEAALAGAGSDPEAAAAVAAELRAQDPAGLAGRVVRSAAGDPLEVDFTTPPSAGPILRHYMNTLRQALEQLAVPFPAVAVGEGARWNAATAARLAGIRLSQAASYRLERRADGTARVALTAQLFAEPQLLELPNLPPGSRCELLTLTAGGSGWLELREGAFFPAAGDLAYDLAMTLRVLSAGKESAMDSQVRLTFQLGTP